MARTVNLRKSLTTLLKSLDVPVFYREAKGHPLQPYIVYTVTPVRDDETLCLGTAEVYVVGSDQDNTAVENTADAVWGLFDHLLVNDSLTSFSAYPNTRQDVSDDNIATIRISIDLRLYK